MLGQGERVLCAVPKGKIDMHEPYISLYVQDGALHFEKKLSTELESRVIFNVPIPEVIADEFDEAAKKLGGTLLRLFQLWHKDLFINWGSSFSELESSSSDNFTLALGLIDRLSDGCSEDRLKLIDEILVDAATSDLDASKYLSENWPYLRVRLLGQRVEIRTNDSSV